MIVRDTDIDAVVLRHCQRQSKVAQVNHVTVLEFESRGVRVSEERVARRIQALVRRGRLKASGDIRFWRWSEIKALEGAGRERLLLSAPARWPQSSADAPWPKADNCALSFALAARLLRALSEARPCARHQRHEAWILANRI